MLVRTICGSGWFLFQSAVGGWQKADNHQKNLDCRLLPPTSNLRITRPLPQAVLTFMIDIIQAETVEQIEQARGLFREYEAWFGMNLCFQNFDEEVANLPGKYAAPEGRLFLAFSDKKLAGCIALRKLEGGVCEMKRLFVKDEFRAQKIGVLLIEKLIEEARQIGYERMRLDTYPPRMGKAVNLYESYGFHEIPPYYHNPYGETLYMELNLSR